MVTPDNDQRALEARLFAHMRSRQADPGIPTGGSLTEAPLSFAQRRLWFIDQLEPGSVDYLLPMACRIRGALDSRALEASLSRLVERHHTLRTRFARDGAGEPVQIIEEPWPVQMAVVDLRGQSDPGRREASVRSLTEAELNTPFDLTAGRPIRVALACLPGDEYRLLLVVPHIVCDGWSAEVLVRDLCALYTHEAGLAAAAAVPALAIQYADFAVQQRQRLTGEVLDRQLSYWRERLAAVRPLELPEDRLRSQTRSCPGDAVTFTVAPDVTGALRRVAANHGASLFMVCLAAFQAVLARWSGQDDVVVGSPIAGRNRAEVEDLVGFFVNTLVLRADLGGDPTFGELIDQVKGTALGGYAHQELPFERLVEELAPERDITRNPLLQVVFQLETASEKEPWSVPGLSVQAVTVSTRVRSKFDLSCVLTERDGGHLAGELEFATDVFEPATARQLARHLSLVLKAMAVDSRQRIAAVDLLSDEERRLILPRPGDDGAPHQDAVLVHHLVEERIARTPGAIAVVDGSTQYTYRELGERAERLCWYLRSRGIRHQDRVAVYGERDAAIMVALLGISKAGAVYVPLDLQWPGERLASVLRDADVALALAHEPLLPRLEQLSTVSVLALADDWPAVALPTGDEPAPRVRPDDLACILYEPAGDAAGVMIEHRSISRMAGGGTAAQLDATDVVGLGSGLCSWTFTFEYWGTLAAGATLAIVPAKTLADSALLADILRVHGVTHLGLPAALFSRHLTERPDLVAGLQTMLYGSEAAEPSVVHAVLTAPRPPRRLLSCYGRAETTAFATCHAVEAAQARRPTVPIGRPVRDAEAFVLDAGGRLSPIGVPGELWIAGDMMARGYWNRPELTEQRFARHPFSDDQDTRAYRTGELARWLPGGCLEFVRLGGRVASRQQRPVSAPDAEGTSPRNALEQAIADVWREVLAVERVGIHDNFFDLGGHSLQIVRIVNRLEERDIAITIRQVMREQSVARIAESITASSTA